MTLLPICGYCGQDAKLVGAKHIYPKKHWYRLRDHHFWRCDACDAHVGCYPGPKHIPLGTLADKATRQARREAHAMFDPLWRSGRLTRRQAYRWLSMVLECDQDQAHLGLCNVTYCHRVMVAVQRLERRFQASRPRARA